MEWSEKDGRAILIIGDERIRRASDDDIQGMISVVGWHLYELFKTMR